MCTKPENSKDWHLKFENALDMIAEYLGLFFLLILSGFVILETIKASLFGLELEPLIEVGDLLTIITIGISAAVLLYNMRKDQQQRRREYADKIRSAASITIAKLERWNELNFRFFQDIQPLISRTDDILVKNYSCSKARGFFYDGLFNARNTFYQRLVDEQIEMAFKELSGYDEIIDNFFSESVNRLKSIETINYLSLFYYFQLDLDIYFEDRRIESIRSERVQKQLETAKFTNLFQNTVNMHNLECYNVLMGGEIRIFKQEIKNSLINKEVSDDQIINKMFIRPSYNPEGYLKYAFEGFCNRYMGIYLQRICMIDKNENEAQNTKYFYASIKCYDNAIKISTNLTPNIKAGLYAGLALSQKAIKDPKSEDNINEAMKLLNSSRTNNLC